MILSDNITAANKGGYMAALRINSHRHITAERKAVAVRRKQMKSTILLVILTLAFSFSFSQVNHQKAFRLVLEGDAVGKVYSFDQTKGTNHDSLVLIYLGKIKTNKGRILKILTSRWYWGLSPRATSRIIIFNQKNQYLGDYYLTMTYDIPDKIEDNSLIFTNNKESDCTPNLITKVSFKKGIPRRFFLRCKDKLGDLYSFDQNL